MEAKHGPEVDGIMDKVVDYGTMEREHAVRGIGVPAPMHRTPQKMIDLLDEIEKDLVQLVNNYEPSRIANNHSVTYRLPLKK
tara:strand:+ start:4355 stop:4600 length:246 start_codon:yes stop_codon:yes gene_type:complete